MPIFECRQCDPGCSLETSEEEATVPEFCPWKGGEAEVAWKEVDL